MSAGWTLGFQQREVCGYTPDFDYEEKFRGKWRRVTEDAKFSTNAKSDEKRKLKFTTAYQIFRIKVKLMRQVHGLIVKEV